MEVRNAWRKAAQSSSKTSPRLVARHNRVPASTAICTSRGSQGMQARGGGKVGISFNWRERSSISVTVPEAFLNFDSIKGTLEIYSWKGFPGIIYTIPQHQYRMAYIKLFLTDAWFLTASSEGDSAVTVSSIPSCYCIVLLMRNVFLITNPNLSWYKLRYQLLTLCLHWTQPTLESTSWQLQTYWADCCISPSLGSLFLVQPNFLLSFRRAQDFRTVSHLYCFPLSSLEFEAKQTSKITLFGFTRPCY